MFLKNSLGAGYFTMPTRSIPSQLSKNVTHELKHFWLKSQIFTYIQYEEALINYVKYLVKGSM